MAAHCNYVSSEKWVESPESQPISCRVAAKVTDGVI